jgi:hypothetical protein
VRVVQGYRGTDVAQGVVHCYRSSTGVQGYRCTGVVQVFNGYRRSTGVQVTGVVGG